MPGIHGRRNRSVGLNFDRKEYPRRFGNKGGRFGGSIIQQLLRLCDELLHDVGALDSTSHNFYDTVGVHRFLALRFFRSPLHAPRSSVLGVRHGKLDIQSCRRRHCPTYFLHRFQCYKCMDTTNVMQSIVRRLTKSLTIWESTPNLLYNGIVQV